MGQYWERLGAHVRVDVGSAEARTRFGTRQHYKSPFQRVFDQLQENLITYIQPTQDIKVTEVKGSFKRLKLIDVPGKMKNPFKTFQIKNKF